LRIEPGDEVAFECVDASGGQVHPAMTTAEFLTIDRTRIHPLTGPVWVEAAEPGDVLQIDVLSTRHAG
jgi:acetamidase/formamidase